MHTRRALMAERDKAVAAKDWCRMNALTRQIAELPLAGMPALTDRDIARYVVGKASRKTKR